MKVVGAEAADDFLDTLTPHLDMSLSEIFGSIVEPKQGSQVTFSLSFFFCLSLFILVFFIGLEPTV